MTQRQGMALIGICTFLFGIILGAVGAIAYGTGDITATLNMNSGAITAAFTLVLAISTIGLWVATHNLWTTAETQIAIAQKAAEAAGASATASLDSLGLAKQVAASQLRAYITTAKYYLLDYKLEVGTSLQACISIRNRGQTPAHNVSYTLMSILVPVAETDSTLITLDPSAKFTMAPGERSVLAADSVDLEVDDVASIKAGEKTILLLCHLEYTDDFGTAHQTRMRASLNKDNHVDAKGRMQLEWHGFDNDMT